MQAVDDAYMAQDSMGEQMADFLDTVYRRLPKRVRSAMLGIFKHGVLQGYLLAAEEFHSARKRGVAKAVAKRNQSASSRYAEYAAYYYSSTTGSEAQRQTATANHFGITDRTVRRAIKSAG